MGQRTLDDADITTRRELHRTLIQARLPNGAAQADDWPIQHDHCFARVILDIVFGGIWYEHVDKRPACERLSAEEVDAAIDILKCVLQPGAPVGTQLNEQSLRWRDEL
jgi:hypothetical protein